MQKPSLFYVSTNEIWGGSEVLWTLSAKTLLKKGYRINCATQYAHEKIDELIAGGAGYVHLHTRVNIFKRTVNFLSRVAKVRISDADELYKTIQNAQPDLLIISQGNNIGAVEVMKVCRTLGIKYITVTQLVTEFLWLFLNDEKIERLRDCYKAAELNLFVSKANRDLNDYMIGEKLSNTDVVFNPFTAVRDYKDVFPNEGIMKVAIVGRLECMHKGMDLIIELADSDKWKSRPIEFTFYGDGPHRRWLEKHIAERRLTKVKLAGHVKDIKSIWNQNHILLMASRMEGQSIALIEAMYCSRPAIATNVGGVSELILDGENGFICANPSVKDLDDCMERAWEARSEWKQMGERAGKKIRAIYPPDPVEHFNNIIIKKLPRNAS